METVIAAVIEILEWLYFSQVACSQIVSDGLPGLSVERCLLSANNGHALRRKPRREAGVP